MPSDSSNDQYSSVFRPDLFKGKLAVVTGGGTGIGRCIAHELASLGATVAIWGRRVEPLEETAAEILHDGGRAITVTGDIRDEKMVGETVDGLIATHQRIDMLVNNAGGQFSALANDISANGFDAVVRTNLLGGFLVAKACYAASFHEHGGSVVNITADHGRGIPFMAHSSASRAGMANLTRTLAVEWASAGVRVNAVAPGFVASSGYDTYEGEPFHERLESLPRLTLAQRHGTESEVSAAVTFLLSDAAAYITGQELLVGGGSDLMNGLLEIDHHDRLPAFNGFHRSSQPDILSADGASDDGS
ncbi:MAG: 2,4-dienoyl-CoA reductase [Actinobacteria bacterium]|nr:MAG: 2,4-dienoyl-CoA reductase [Actinomycetota bacterium]